MYPDLVVLSHGRDEHALAVLTALSSAVRPVLLDVGREGVDFVSAMDDDGRLMLCSRSGERFDLSDVPFWWNRRPRFKPHAGTPPTHGRAQEVEAINFWTGCFNQFSDRVWCNPFDAQTMASNKLRQVFLARACGLRTPETIWSNNPDEIAIFWERHKRQAIIKMFEGTEDVWQPTRPLTESIMRRRELLRFAPAIVQAYIGGEVEFRVIIFGEHIFTTSTAVGASRFPFDTRIDTTSARRAATIDRDTELKLRAYMQRAGLLYAAFDLREDQDSEPVFLEVNPMGQFLYLDRAHDGGILRAFCAFIEGHVTRLSNTKLVEPNAGPWQNWSGGTPLPYFDAMDDRITHLT